MLVYRFPDGEEREIPVSAIVEAVLLAVRRRRRLKLLKEGRPDAPDEAFIARDIAHWSGVTLPLVKMIVEEYLKRL